VLTPLAALCYPPKLHLLAFQILEYSSYLVVAEALVHHLEEVVEEAQSLLVEEAVAVGQILVVVAEGVGQNQVVVVVAVVRSQEEALVEVVEVEVEVEEALVAVVVQIQEEALVVVVEEELVAECQEVILSFIQFHLNLMKVELYLIVVKAIFIS